MLLSLEILKIIDKFRQQINKKWALLAFLLLSLYFDLKTNVLFVNILIERENNNYRFNLHETNCIPFFVSEDPKQRPDQDDTPPCTPTNNPLSSESDLEVSSPSNEVVSSSINPIVSQEEDERLAKELSLKEAAAHDLSHRPKRRRFHESYNFNMKCPTPGCNSLGKDTTTEDTTTVFFNLPNLICLLFAFIPLSFYSRTSNWEAWETFLHIWMSTLPQSFCWWMQGT